MSSAPFAELAARSHFSFLEGSASPRDLVEVAARLEIGSLGLCDRNGLYGAVGFIEAARKAGIRPVVGVELDLVDAGRIRLLARGRRGYRQLCRAISAAQLAGVKGQPRLRIAGFTDELAGEAGGWELGAADEIEARGYGVDPRTRRRGGACAAMVCRRQQMQCCRDKGAARQSGRADARTGAKHHPRASVPRTEAKHHPRGLPGRRQPHAPSAIPPAGAPAHGRSLPRGLAIAPLDPGPGGEPAGGGGPRRPRRLHRARRGTGERGGRRPRRPVTGEAPSVRPRRLRECFGRDRAALLLTNHLHPADRWLAAEVAELAERAGLPLVASATPVHATRDDKPLLDVLTAIRHRTTLDRAAAHGLLLPNCEHRLLPEAVLRRRLPGFPGAFDHAAQHRGASAASTSTSPGFASPASPSPQARPPSRSSTGSARTRSGSATGRSPPRWPGACRWSSTSSSGPIWPSSS